MKKGVSDPLIASGAFTRAQLAAISYQALASSVKGGGTPLLAKLVADGAVDAETAAPLLRKINTYRAYAAVLADMYKDGEFAIDTSGSVDMTLHVPAAGVEVIFRLLMDMQVILDKEDIGMAVTVAANAERLRGTDKIPGTGLTIPKTFKISVWLQDGWLYTDMMGAKTKEPSEIDLSMAAMGLSFDDIFTADRLNSGFYMVDGLTAEETADGTLYTVTYGDVLAGVLALTGEMTGARGVSVKLGNCFIKTLVGKNGVPKFVDTEMTTVITTEMTGEIIYQVTAHFGVNAAGGGVVIDYPDFSEFAGPGTNPLPEISPEPEA